MSSNDCRHKGHSDFSRPQLIIHVQQNMCPHSVAVGAVRSSRQSVHRRADRASGENAEISSTVCLSEVARSSKYGQETGYHRNITRRCSAYPHPNLLFLHSGLPVVRQRTESRCTCSCRLGLVAFFVASNDLGNLIFLEACRGSFRSEW